MRKIAQSRGGKCFSETYKDNKTKLRWKCAKGHEWEATPNNIKSKAQWCPECNKEKGKKRKNLLGKR
ncbi:zinc-ribbon domain-containing protein [Bacillus thuringiensis]|uniref:zinc-ribbon domain-containing protein n=1 Tax=Bacillus thuringiensis TaxID=1428 RepID=UPI0039B56CE7